MLGFTGPFLAEVAKTVIEMMGSHYDELTRRHDFILSNIEQEEPLQPDVDQRVGAAG